MRRFLGARPANATKSLTALDEPQALHDALKSASLIMNDEVEKAEAELSESTSPFHKLGLALTVFLRATLGFEKEIIELARVKLDEAEETASEHERRATRDPSTAHHSAIYPVGAEYALCHAESQLMSAVVAVLNESLTESLKGFYKLRKAFNTLHRLREAEKEYLRRHQSDVSGSKRSSLTSTQTASSIDKASSQSSGILTPVSVDTDDEETLDFEDAKEDTSSLATPPAYQGNLEYPTIPSLQLEETHLEARDMQASGDASSSQGSKQPESRSTSGEIDEEIGIQSVTSDPIDLFIHAGTGLCFGVLQLLLSMIPPAFAKVLNIFSFRGDRQEGIELLWAATRFKTNINGAMAGLFMLGYYNTALDSCEIKSKEATPKARLKQLLREMRELYPNSKLWIQEEAKMLASEKEPEKAVELLSADSPGSSLRQVTALGKFDLSLNLMYLHRYEDCASSFIECVSLNSWSHALYYYNAGCCYVELYRISKTKDSMQAAKYANRAEKYLREVPGHLGKKRLMGRQLPINAFVSRKITKWEARAKARNCRLVDAVGVSPTVEMTYFWSGFRRMRIEHLDKSLERLAWSENLELNPNWESEAEDEKAVLAFLRGVCQRSAGDIGKARETFTNDVLSHDLNRLKACEHPETWSLPLAHYELAVCEWQESGAGDDNNNKGGDRSALLRCSEEITKIEKWEPFDLEARVGLKVTTARETLQRCGVRSE